MPCQYNPEYYNKNKEKFKKAHTKWRKSHLKERAQYQRNYYKHNQEMIKRIMKNFWERNPDHLRAYSMSQLIPKKKNCQRCGSPENLERHHPDYLKPKQFFTLCRNCHKKEHADQNA